MVLPKIALNICEMCLVLIKESMFFNNLAFTEANHLYPKTESHFCLAEQKNEFPSLPNRQPKIQEERIEANFPRKTQQELLKQYQDYVNINQ